MFTIDIDRLHRVADGTLIGRRQGHTLLSVTHLAALISMRESVIYCVLDTDYSISYVKHMITDVCGFYELPFVQWIGRLYFECMQSKVFFIFANDNKVLSGIPNNTPIIFLFET